MTDTRIEALLPTSLLEEFRGRAGTFDTENRFFAEDFEALREQGYLAAAAPEAVGGAGLSLEELVRAQRRLASYAPATALGVNMHLVWVQVARFLRDREQGVEGEGPLDWVLRDAVDGEVFAFGISEAGNEAVLLDSASVATAQPDGGYLVSGTKIFTTLSPVWTRLGVHAKTAVAADNKPDSNSVADSGSGSDSGIGSDDVAGAGAEGSRLVFGFVRRDEALNENLLAGKIEHPGTWNPLGMRATQSYTTLLDRVRIEPADVAATMPPYDGRDPLVLAIFSSFSVLTAAVYAGIADRALELATEAVRRPTQRSDGGAGTRLDDPDLAAKLTEAVLAHRRSLDALELLARDVDEQRPRSDWFLALAAARNLVTDEARSAVDVAMRVVGAQGFQADSELARLYRDVLAGLFHPSSSRALAKTVRDSLS